MRVNMQVSKSILIAIIIAVSLASYFNTLFAHFVWDDNIFIMNNAYMQSFKYLPKFFFHDFWSIGFRTLNSGYYRPVLAASFILDYTLWQNNPFGYHLTNLILHTLACILLFLFVETLIKDRRIALFSSLIFSAHPIHTEAVSFVSGRVDIIPLVFVLLSLLLFLRYALNKKFLLYLFSLFCFFLALLAKEMAVTLPLIVLCMDYFFLSKQKTKDVLKNFSRLHLGFFIILGLYLLMRFYTIGWSFLLENKRYVSNFLPGKGHYWELFTVIKILTFYIRLLFFPYGLKVDYFFPAANSLFEPVVFLGVLSLLGLALLVLKNLKTYPVVSFSILWFFITVLPVSNILSQGNIFAERYMYIPSVGFSIGIGFLFPWLMNKDIRTNLLSWKKSIFLVFFLLIIASGRITFERNKVWNNEFSLWYDTAKASPNSPRAHINLASAYYALNLLDKAEDEANKALHLYHRYYEAYDTLGHIFLKQGSVDKAIEMYKIASKIFPDRAQAYKSLAVAYDKKGQYKEAIEVSLKALELNPYFDEARYNLALSYSHCGLIDEAIQAYETYLVTCPDYPGVHVDVGHLYYKKGDLQKAKEHWLAALKLSKDYQPAKDALALLEN